jgi:hypothetical protein
MLESAQLISSLATLLTAAASMIVLLRNTKKIDQVRVATDGITERLVATTKKAAFAEGVKTEKESPS